MSLQIFAINDPQGAVVAPDWLTRAEAVHRQLRPQLPPDYAVAMEAVFGGGGRMCVAAIAEKVVGVAVYRVYVNTFAGLQMYVDDLVTDEATRSTGVGKALLDHLQGLARGAGCRSFDLDSGVQRARAHRFYFREGMVVGAFHFDKRLD